MGRTSFSSVVGGSVVCFAVFLAGCGSSGKESCKEATASAAPEAGMINANCVVMPKDDARGSGVAVAYNGKVDSWKGKKVAFCCDDCVKTWEKMTDAQRDAALEKVASK